MTGATYRVSGRLDTADFFAPVGLPIPGTGNAVTAYHPLLIAQTEFYVEEVGSPNPVPFEQTTAAELPGSAHPARTAVSLELLADAGASEV